MIYQRLASMMIAAGSAFGLGAAAHAQEDSAHAPAETAAQEATPANYKFPELGDTRVIGAQEALAIPKQHGSELLVVNYWATWCSPCVAEIPYFVKLAKEYEKEEVRVVGFSVDLKKDVESKVIPFLRTREIPYSNVVLFMEDADSYIDQVSKSWSGEVPATFFYDKNGEKLGEILGETDYEVLKAKVEEIKAASASTQAGGEQKKEAAGG